MFSFQQKCSSFHSGNANAVTLIAEMKYSPQQQQKERKSESEIGSIGNGTPCRGSSSDRKNSSTSSRSSRSLVCRSPSTGMFAWMRVFRLATMLHQVGC